ncbi:hypothetical protein ACOMHN_055000 [Nucella lapillus]
MLDRKLGKRVSMMVGGFLSTVGFFAGGFADSLPVLIVCAGAIAGSGASMLNLSNLSSVVRRFRKRAGLVASAMALSSGLVMLAGSFLTRYLADQYTWRGCLILASGITLQVLPTSILLTSPLLEPARAPGGTPTPLLSPPHNPDPPDVETSRQVSSPRVHQESGSDNQGEDFLGTCDGECSTRKSDLNSGSALFSDFNTKDRTGLGPNVVTQSSRNFAEKSFPPNRQLTSQPVPEDEDGCTTDDEITDSDPIPTLSIKRLTNDRDPNSVPLHPAVLVSRSDHERPTTDQDSLLVKDQHGGWEEMRNGQKAEHGDFLNTRQGESHTRQEPHKDTVMETNSGEHTTPANRGSSEELTNTESSAKPARLGVVNAFVFLVLDFAGSRGWSREEGLFLNFIFMTANLVSRLVAVLVSLSPRDSCVALMMSAGIVGGLASCLLGQVGLAISMFSPCVLLGAGAHHYPLAVGLCLTLTGLSIITLTRLTGNGYDNKDNVNTTLTTIITLTRLTVCAANSGLRAEVEFSF